MFVIKQLKQHFNVIDSYEYGLILNGSSVFIDGVPNNSINQKSIKISLDFTNIINTVNKLTLCPLNDTLHYVQCNKHVLQVLCLLYFYQIDMKAISEYLSVISEYTFA